VTDHIKAAASSNTNVDGNSGFSGTLKRPLVFDGTASPVKTALFLLICAAWLLPGLIGHDPWKPDEAMAMGIVHAMLENRDTLAWLLPQIAGQPAPDYPPLYYWTAALFASMFSWLLPVHDAARLTSGFFMLLTIVYLYKAANKLIDERAGRIAVALLLGSLGLLLRAHELNPEIAALAGMSIAIYGLTRIRFEPRKGGTTAGIGAAIVALSVGLVHALIVPLAAIGMLALLHDWRNAAFRRGIGFCLLSLGVGAAIYPVLLLIYNVGDTRIAIDAILGTPLFDQHLRSLISPTYYLQILPWYALPTLPMALWLWRKDRRVIGERIELALPLAVFLAALIVLSFAREARDVVGVTLLLPLALAAAHSLDRLPKGVASFVDWFGLVFFGALAAGIWLYWSAALLGTPEAAARAMARAAPGFQMQFSWLPFIIGATLTIVWMYAVAMAHRNNRRAIVNWVAGITLIWVLLNVLGLPAIDHVRSYRQPVGAVAAQLVRQPGCVIGVNIGEPQRAMFDYFAGQRFVAPKSAQASSCPWMLMQGTKQNAPDVSAPWALVWEGARPAERVEQFRLYLRQPTSVASR
jgi:4-amino-4-deoxy-L-arabinose transferase-like glycosyltransferase